MTSNRSNYRFSYGNVIFAAAVLAVLVISEAPTGSILLYSAVLGFGIYRDHRRRSTLRQRDDGVYVWIEWHGGERSSPCDPTEEWDSECDGDGDGGD